MNLMAVVGEPRSVDSCTPAYVQDPKRTGGKMPTEDLLGPDQLQAAGPTSQTGRFVHITLVVIPDLPHHVGHPSSVERRLGEPRGRFLPRRRVSWLVP